MNVTLTRRSSVEPNTHEMVVIHRIFRREVRLLADLVRQAPAGDLDHATEVGGHAEFILTGLHHHHSAEDEFLWPLLLDRAQPQAELVQQMEAQHAAVGEHSGHARRLLAQWRSAPSAAVGDQLADALTGLSVALIEHLDEEEARILPLVRTHVTPAEWEELGQRSFDKFPRSALLIMLGQVLEDATPADRDLFLGKLPPPVRLMWRLSGRRRYARYIRRVRGRQAQ